MNGIIGEVSLSAINAADGRHGPVLKNIGLPETHAKIPVGEVLFKKATGAVSLKDAVANTLNTTAFNGSTTDAAVAFGMPLVPGSVKATVGDAIIQDNADGTLGATGDDGDGVVDYATGKVNVSFTDAPANNAVATVVAVPLSSFAGVCNEDAETDDESVLAVIHGTIVPDIAKINGQPLTAKQIEALNSVGIY